MLNSQIPLAAFLNKFSHEAVHTYTWSSVCCVSHFLVPYILVLHFLPRAFLVHDLLVLSFQSLIISSINSLSVFDNSNSGSG